MPLGAGLYDERPGRKRGRIRFTAHQGFLWIGVSWPELPVPSRRTFAAAFLAFAYSEETSLRLRGSARFPMPLAWHWQLIQPMEFPEGPGLPMSSPPPIRRYLSVPTPEEFLAALAAGLPASCPGGFPIVVGVSGGADSVGLLVGLHRLLRVPIVVAHAEHDLRAEAADDRRFVERLAAQLGLACEWRRLSVREDRAQQGEGLEARARRLRYGFLADVAHARGGRHVLVAHTADDQAETILHRILRGTGLAGLAGMRPARELCDGVALVRPFLGIARAEVRRFLEQVAISWQEDATNADVSRARNFLRHEVLPRCRVGPYPAATEALVRLGRQAAVVADALGAAAAHLLYRASRRQADGAVVIRTRELAGLGDRHLLAEVVVALWTREGWPRRDMTTAHYAAVAGLLDQPGRPAAVTIELPGGLRASVDSDGEVRIGPAAVNPRPNRSCLP